MASLLAVRQREETNLPTNPGKGPALTGRRFNSKGEHIADTCASEMLRGRVVSRE